MGAFTKRWTIQRRLARRQKLDQLRKRYREARSDDDRVAIIGKVRKVSSISEEEFLGPIRS